MHKQSPPFLFHSPEDQFPDKAGLSGWVPLIESGISIHTLTKKYWEPWLRGMLRTEEPTPGRDLEQEPSRRKALIRRLVTRVGAADIRRPDPLGDGEMFDLIGSWYCLECVGASRDEWLRYLRNLTSRLNPGGVLLMGALRRTNAYHVLGRVFEVTSVGEADFRRELPELGFAPETLEVEVASVSDFVDQGFESLCCVRAIKGDARPIRWKQLGHGWTAGASRAPGILHRPPDG